MSLPSDTAALLQTYAQVGVGFAGFAGVIGAFGRLRVHPEATVFRVRALVAVGLALVIFSMLPTMFGAFGASETVTWRASAGPAAVACSGLLAILARQVHALYAKGFLRTQVATRVLEVAAAALIAALYAVAFGAVPAYAAGFYLAMLFFGVILSAYYFFMLMIAVRLDESE